MNKLVSQLIAAATFPLYTLVAATSSYAVIPEYAKVTEIVGPNQLNVRSGSRVSPVNIGSILRRFQEQLMMPGTDLTFAKLGFFDSSDKPLGFNVQANTENRSFTLYYLPCSALNGDTYVIEWLNSDKGDKGCKEGVRVQPGGNPRGQFPWTEEIFAADWNKQRNRRGIENYCSVIADSGKSWMNISSTGNPCNQPIEECQSGGESGCEAVTLDSWFVRNQNLTTIVSCDNDQILTAEGSGAKTKELATQVWQQAQAENLSNCSLRVLSPQDKVLIPPSPETERIITRIRNERGCQEVYVKSGSVQIVTAKTPTGVTVSPGEDYVYCDRQQDDYFQASPSGEPIEVQVFMAKERGLEFCDTEHDSGGSEVSKKKIQLTATEGEIRISYEMYGVPDRLQVVYEGKYLVDTGLISGSDVLSIPFKGNSGQVEVIMTGNQETGTQWNYTLSCPS